MATLVANRAMDVNGLAAASRTHTQAVTRNYISQPRLSTLLMQTSSSKGVVAVGNGITVTQ